MPKVKLYVGNLPFSTTAENILNDFPSIGGEVFDPIVVMDKETGRSRGFGFITVKESDAETFLQATGTEYESRKLVINKAIEKERKPRTDSRSQNNRNRDNNSRGSNQGEGDFRRRNIG